MTTSFALSALIAVFVSQAQQTDEGKPILKAKAVDSSGSEKTPTLSPKPTASPRNKKKATSPSPSPKKKPKAKKSPGEEPEASSKPSETPEATPRSKPKKSSSKESETSATPKETPEAATHPKPKKSPAKEASAKGKKKKKTNPEKTSTPKKRNAAKPSETPEIRRATTPPPTAAVPSPSAQPPPVPRAKSALAAPAAPVQEPEQLTIEKYGYEKPKGFWARLFGGGGGGSSKGGAGYRYLTASVRSQIDRAPVTRGRWQYIVVHNSGTRQGNAAAFDYYHRHFRRMQNGLAYHFVIGNGTSTGNGQVEVGDRWRRQINGGHVHSDYLNNIALGICLVGDFNRDQPTRAQLDCCEELIRYLRQRCGKVGDHYPIVKPHREINPPRWATDCPGDVFPYSWFRRF
ncbi:MAG TPA: N-acetylmuramoyl-L-alanine amidase [Chthoniobacterales bacterium]|nr:N-acetylmuramoyl-L-alanine amidase [Chthoniobacterales bacterium]